MPLDQDLPVWILPGDGSAEHLKLLNGLSAAYTIESGGFRVVIYPLEGWLSVLPFVLAHEYHHAVHYQVTPNLDQSLLGPIIAEAMADHFASTLYPNTNVIWLSPNFPFRPGEEVDAYQFLLRRKDDPKWQRLINSKLFLVGELPYGDMTRYTGRAIAHGIVQGYVSSRKISVLELLKIDPKAIFEESAYRPQDSG